MLHLSRNVILINKISPMKADKHLIKSLRSKELQFSFFISLFLWTSFSSPKIIIIITLRCICFHWRHLFFAWIMTSGAWTLPRMSILHIFWLSLSICVAQAFKCMQCLDHLKYWMKNWSFQQFFFLSFFLVRKASEVLSNSHGCVSLLRSCF